MNRRIVYSLSILFLLSAVLTTIGCGNKPIATPYVAEEFVVCNAGGNQIFPSISGNIVVWTDYRNEDEDLFDNGDIYGYNLNNGVELPICTEDSYQGSLDIDGDIVVWTDGRNDYSDTSNSDIYGYNLSTGIEFIICNEPDRQGAPSISGDTVVWMEYRADTDYVTYIYGCQMDTGEVFPISTYESMKMFPSVCGDLVTWLDFRKVDLSTLSQQPQPVLNTEIYGCNLSSLLEFAITDDEYMQDMPGPDMYNNTLVWSECTEGLCVIYSYDLLTQTKATLSTSQDAMVAPAIYGDIVVWTDYRNDNGDIYGYNLETGEEFAICTDPGEQHNPAISGNIVVWVDDRAEIANTYDIYGARLTFDNP